MCKSCVLSLMGRHVLNYLRELKAQRRASRPSSPGVSGGGLTFYLDGPQAENCWYGFNCRTQGERDHAAKLNVRAVVPASVVSI